MFGTRFRLKLAIPQQECTAIPTSSDARPIQDPAIPMPVAMDSLVVLQLASCKFAFVGTFAIPCLTFTQSGSLQLPGVPHVLPFVGRYCFSGDSLRWQSSLRSKHKSLLEGSRLECLSGQSVYVHDSRPDGTVAIESQHLLHLHGIDIGRQPNPLPRPVPLSSR